MQKKAPYSAADEAMARYAKALGHPARVFILRYLEQQSGCVVGDLSEQLPIAGSTLSQHLKTLREAGLIQGTISPPNIRYCINPVAFAEAKALFAAFF